MDYKTSLLLPVTTFAMKANLSINEPVLQKNWLNKKIYQKKLAINLKYKTKYIFLDGPPYANGSIHIGHALNKILKDFNIRFQNSQNKYCPFILGWDTHGLPIENAIEKQGYDKKSLSRIDFCKKCHEYATKQISLQMNQFQSLGLFTDYQTTYFTYNKDYEYKQLEYFYQMLASKLIYQNFKPIYWSWSSESALAEAEIEYLEKQSYSIYVKFKLIENQYLPANTSIIIWTTTPWTLAGNQATAINKKFHYCLISDKENNYVVAKELFNNFIKINNLNNFRIIKDLDNSLLSKLKYFHPLNKLQICPIIYSDHVTLDSGTGLVHIAPVHGLDDFYLGQKYKLNILAIINSRGLLINWGHFSNMFYLKAEPLIIKWLQQEGILINQTLIKHQYPHDWRTKKPIVYLATLQWFISIKKNQNEILKNIKPLQTWPSWGKDRLKNMIKSREDWCISRQRYWGVPIAVFFDENKNPVIKKDIFDHILSLVKKNGSLIWYQLSNEQLLPAKYHKYANLWTKENDIMDVWFDSGTAFSQINKIFKNEKTADLFLEGNDQFRGWFNSSLIIASIINKKSPYKKLLTHGFVLDKNGNKMSKSKGNIIDPQVIVKNYGTDILRLWVASINFLEDVRIGEENLKQVSEHYRKIRNTIKFLLGNLNDFSFKKDKKENLQEIDKLILSEIAGIYLNNLKNYQDFKYEKVFTSLLNFIINKLSGFYLDFAKDILYVNKKNDCRRREIQTTIYYVLEIILHSFWPIMPHTIDEAYKAFPNRKILDSFALEPKLNVIKLSKLSNQKWSDFWLLQKDILKALEVARNNKIIGKSLEAEIVCNLKEKYHYFQKWNLQELFMVSNLRYEPKLLDNKNEMDSCYIIVNSFSLNPRCTRCWKHFKTEDMYDKQICKHCHAVLTEK